jgi:hypothetical protein
VSGSATFGGQAGFSRPRLVGGRKGQISAFFDHASGRVLAELRSGSSGDGGPTLTLDLRFEGRPRTEPSAITYCFINVAWPKGGSIGNNTDGKGCGVAQIAGDLRAGGSVSAKVKGQAMGPGEKPYSWDLDQPTDAK